jgi:peptide/nickel transport system substrate-binding protein
VVIRPNPLKTMALISAVLAAYLPLASRGVNAQSPSIDTAKCVKYAGYDDSGTKNSLDPAIQPTSQNSLVVSAVYNRLTDRTADWQVVPELATSWESNADGTAWTFQLRKDVKFWDGHPFTAADVVYTFKRLLDPATGSEGRSTMSFLKADGIVADGDYAVKFNLDHPVAELPLLITNKSTYIVRDGVSSADLRSKGAGTGPFMPVNFEPIQQAHLFVKNPNYWESGLPKSECLQLYVIHEATSLQAALQTGQIDIAQAVSYASIPILKADPAINLLETPPGSLIALPMWVDTHPFDDNRVREALKFSIDRQKLVDTALLGFGVPGDDNPIPPTSPFAWRSQARQRDIPMAKKLLAEAGYSSTNPLKIDLYAADTTPGLINLVQLVKQMAADAGVEINLIIGPASEYWDNVWLKQPFEISGWSPRPPGEALAVAYLANAPYPETHWKVPEFDALVQKANTTVDAAARKQVYQEAEKMLSMQGGEIIPVFRKTVAASRANCSGYKPNVEPVRADFRAVECKR